MNNTTTPFEAVIGGQKVIVNPVLAGFELLKKTSSNVDYFAICRQTSQLFIQFSNGKGFLYNNVPTEVLEAAKDAESIGKFFHASIKGKYEDQPVSDNAIVIAPPAEDEDEDWDPDEDLGDEDDEDLEGELHY